MTNEYDRVTVVDHPDGPAQAVQAAQQGHVLEGLPRPRARARRCSRATRPRAIWPSRTCEVETPICKTDVQAGVTARRWSSCPSCARASAWWRACRSSCRRTFVGAPRHVPRPRAPTSRTSITRRCPTASRSATCSWWTPCSPPAARPWPPSSTCAEIGVKNIKLMVLVAAPAAYRGRARRRPGRADLHLRRRRGPERRTPTSSPAWATPATAFSAPI